MKNKKYKGFSLIESTIGVAIAGIIFVAFLEILPKAIIAENYAKNNLIATNLAQEGIEIARNYRDNALKNNNCDNVFTSCSFEFSDGSIINFSNLAGKLNDQTASPKFKNPGFGTFERDISISNITDDSAVVQCRVRWILNGTTYSEYVVIENDLASWGEKE